MPPNPYNARLNGVQSRCGRLGGKKDLWPPKRIGPRFLCCPAGGLVTLNDYAFRTAYLGTLINVDKIITTIWILGKVCMVGEWYQMARNCVQLCVVVKNGRISPRVHTKEAGDFVSNWITADRPIAREQKNSVDSFVTFLAKRQINVLLVVYSWQQNTLVFRFKWKSFPTVLP